MRKFTLLFALFLLLSGLAVSLVPLTFTLVQARMWLLLTPLHKESSIMVSGYTTEQVRIITFSELLGSMLKLFRRM